MLQVMHYYIISGFFIVVQNFFVFVWVKVCYLKVEINLLRLLYRIYLLKSYYLNFKKHRSLICNLNSIMFGINFLFKTH